MLTGWDSIAWAASTTTKAPAALATRAISSTGSTIAVLEVMWSIITSRVLSPSAFDSAATTLSADVTGRGRSTMRKVAPDRSHLSFSIFFVLP